MHETVKAREHCARCISAGRKQKYTDKSRIAWEEAVSIIPNIPLKSSACTFFSFHQTARRIGFCQMPSGERERGERDAVDRKPWHPTWKPEALCEACWGAPASTLWTNPRRRSPKHVRAAAHPSLLIRRSPAGPSIHAALWFLTVSFSLCLLFAWSAGDAGPGGEKKNTSVATCLSAARISNRVSPCVQGC